MSSKPVSERLSLEDFTRILDQGYYHFFQKISINDFYSMHRRALREYPGTQKFSIKLHIHEIREMKDVRIESKPITKSTSIDDSGKSKPVIKYDINMKRMIENTKRQLNHFSTLMNASFNEFDRVVTQKIKKPTGILVECKNRFEVFVEKSHHPKNETKSFDESYYKSKIESLQNGLKRLENPWPDIIDDRAEKRWPSDDTIKSKNLISKTLNDEIDWNDDCKSDVNNFLNKLIKYNKEIGNSLMNRIDLDTTSDDTKILNLKLAIKSRIVNIIINSMCRIQENVWLPLDGLFIPRKFESELTEMYDSDD
jgi:hypothetical protein